MDLLRDPINNAVYNGIKKGIKVALDNECWGSAVILIYSGIDTMANLGRSVGQKEVEPRDFINWVDKYIRIDAPDTISGEEFYSARCAMIHAYSIESSKTRIGRVRAVGYMHRRGDKVLYNPKINKDFVLLDIHALADAFFNGIDKFLVSAFSNAQLRPVIEDRLRKLLINIPYKTVQEQIKRIGETGERV